MVLSVIEEIKLLEPFCTHSLIIDYKLGVDC